MKLYIIGPVGSGKTTLAKNISKKYNIPYFELDNVVYEYNPKGDIKRTKEEIIKLFSEILKEDNWVIEDVGRTIFNDGFIKADKIIYLKIPKIILYSRIVKRWIKEKLKIEESRYKADLKNLKQMLKWANDDLKDSKLNKIEQYKEKTIVIKYSKVKYTSSYLKNL